MAAIHGRYIRPAKLNPLFTSWRLETSGKRQSTSQIQKDGPESMRHEVKNLYKNLIYLSREWPTDLKPKIKGAFLKNKDVSDAEEIRKLIEKGEYVCREITATYHLRKYRAMKRRYYNDDREKQLEEMFKSFNN